LQSAFPINASGQQEIDPDQTSVMGLNGEADSKAQNARRYIPLFQKAPDSHHAKTNNNSCRVAATKKYFAVYQQKTDQEQREMGRMTRSKIPHQEGGQNKAACRNNCP
jgi:hypothetical protein